jgi:hypothetical protein
VPRATPQSLSRQERALLDETSAERLRAMDEDALLALHSRVRRARDRFVQLHRREVAAQVSEARARGAVSVGPRRSASKAEIFEDALARVSSSVARAARATAAALRAERLAAARSARRPAAKSTKTPAATKPSTPRARTRPRSSARRPRQPRPPVPAGRPGETPVDRDGESLAGNEVVIPLSRQEKAKAGGSTTKTVAAQRAKTRR